MKLLGLAEAVARQVRETLSRRGQLITDIRPHLCWSFIMYYFFGWNQISSNCYKGLTILNGRNISFRSKTNRRNKGLIHFNWVCEESRWDFRRRIHTHNSHMTMFCTNQPTTLWLLALSGSFCKWIAALGERSSTELQWILADMLGECLPPRFLSLWWFLRGFVIPETVDRWLKLSILKVW